HRRRLDRPRTGSPDSRAGVAHPDCGLRSGGRGQARHLRLPVTAPGTPRKPLQGLAPEAPGRVDHRQLVPRPCSEGFGRDVKRGETGNGVPARTASTKIAVSHGTPLGTQSVITRTVAVAGGRFAPGHLGEMTQLLPFEMVDEALVQTRAVQ